MIDDLSPDGETDLAPNPWLFRIFSCGAMTDHLRLSLTGEGMACGFAALRPSALGLIVTSRRGQTYSAPGPLTSRAACFSTFGMCLWPGGPYDNSPRPWPWVGVLGLF